MKAKYLLGDSNYHNPQLRLSNAKRQQEAKALIDQFLLDRAQISRIQNIFSKELSDGLSRDADRRSQSSLLMVNTFVPALQSIARETLAGEYISLDIGSSNFRVLYTKLCPHSATDQKTLAHDEDEFIVKYYEIPIEFRKGASEKLFNFLSECIESFLSEIPLARPTDTNAILPLGFTFSFPMTQLAIDAGQLKTWTKNFDLPDAVGVDVATLLQRSLDARRNRFHVRIVALLNDSTGTLIKGSYIDPDCSIGLILGTGNNACYLERMEQIDKWTERAPIYSNFKEILLNMESGGFGDNGSIDFARTRYDRQVDAESLFPGSFTFEKYFSGHYLGKLLRSVLLDLIKNNIILKGIVSDQLGNNLDSVTATDLSSIEGDNYNESVLELIRKLGYDTTTICDDDITVIRYACTRISIRGATLLSAILATLVDRVVGKRRVVIAVDGSLYSKHPRIHRLMTDFIGELITDRMKKFEIIHAEDGSGKGAGIAAALSSKLQLYSNV